MSHQERAKNKNFSRSNRRFYDLSVRFCFFVFFFSYFQCLLVKLFHKSNINRYDIDPNNNIKLVAMVEAPALVGYKSTLFVKCLNKLLATLPKTSLNKHHF
jgi:general stress protein CsbA